MTSKTTSIQAGYIALNDAAILIIAKEQGFAEEEGIDLHLHKETSWATLRDKLAIGMFDVAHLLAPIPIAASCNLFPLPLDIVVPMAMGLGGNMITLSRKIWEAHAGSFDTHDFSAKAAGERLSAILQERRSLRLPKLRFGAVHPYSAHNYELRYWLAGCGIDPDGDVDIVFLPPSTMPDALRSGAVDAYCVGEPWNSSAILAGNGVLLTTKAHIWQSSPEKVLGVVRSFAIEQQEAHFSLLRALYNAAAWIEQPENNQHLCNILSAPHYVGQDPDRLQPGFGGVIETGFGSQKTLEVSDFYLSFSRAATFPWQSHALWFYSQMVRWGHADLNPQNVAKVKETFQPAILRQALEPLGASLPVQNEKIEGALATSNSIASTKGNLALGPDGFFDGRQFDPAELIDYIQSQK